MFYIDKGNEAFRRIRKSEYIDKSGLIAVVNHTLFTEQSFTCVTRCRRFGKSMAAKMLAAYYDRSCDSRSLFADLQIASDPTFEEHLNKYPVICIDLSDFVTRKVDRGIMDRINRALIQDVQKAYPQVPSEEDDDLMEYLMRINAATDDTFVFIIDEWDAILREAAQSSDPTVRQTAPSISDDYVNWLRRMFKGGSSMQVFAGVYMTGILPIKKYKTQSAMNNFLEWYDGYQIGPQPSMFNPNSVMQAIDAEWCRSYWATTGSFEAVTGFIDSNFDGLRDDITVTLAPEYHVLVVSGYSGAEYPAYKDLINVGDIHSCEPWLYSECLAKNIAVRASEWRKKH